jgi:hypothetical protein
LTGYPQTVCIHLMASQLMGDRRLCWLDIVLSALVWMDVMVANVPVVASTVFSIVPGYPGFR